MLKEGFSVIKEDLEREQTKRIHLEPVQMLIMIQYEPELQH